MTRMTDRAALIEDLEAGCTAPADRRIGVEYETFAFRRDSHEPAPYDGDGSVCALLEALAREDFEPERERGALIGLKGAEGDAFSLEPGAQFEYAGAPLGDVGAVQTALERRMGEVARVAARNGLGILPLAFPPHWPRERMPATPMSRYAIMRDYMPKVGTRGLDMMHRTCSAQVNLDFESEADMVLKFRVALALQPVAVALAANSPFAEGRPAGRPSHRGWIWLDVDEARAGLPAFVFEDGMGFEAWVDHALDVPMYSVSRGGRHIDLAGRCFRDFLAGRLEDLPGERPTRGDWRAHLNTLMPETRLKDRLELRGADTGPPRQVAALAAFWTGLLYDRAALSAAWSLVRDWSAEERETLRRLAPQQGLAAPFRRASLREVAAAAVEIAREGLGSRAAGRDDADRLDPFAEAAETGRVEADRWSEAYHGPWRGDLSRVYDAAAL